MPEKYSSLLRVVVSIVSIAYLFGIATATVSSIEIFGLKFNFAGDIAFGDVTVFVVILLAEIALIAEWAIHVLDKNENRAAVMVANHENAMNKIGQLGGLHKNKSININLKSLISYFLRFIFYYFPIAIGIACLAIICINYLKEVGYVSYF